MNVSLLFHPRAAQQAALLPPPPSVPQPRPVALTSNRACSGPTSLSIKPGVPGMPGPATLPRLCAQSTERASSAAGATVDAMTNAQLSAMLKPAQLSAPGRRHIHAARGVGASMVGRGGGWV